MTQAARIKNLAPVHVPGADALPVLEALAGGGVLAMLTAIDGRFYRPVGAMMALLPDGQQIGQLSGGCIEADLATHAAHMDADRCKTLRYGQGAPFIDIRLPCGSAIEVTLRQVNGSDLTDVRADLAARDNAVLDLPGLPAVCIAPPLRLALFGTGAEADQMALLAQAAGVDVVRPAARDATEFDAHTAVALFFHDHHREIAILRRALASPAFWIGAQGSAQAQKNRIAALQDHGVAPDQIARVHGPIGLIPKARDPRTLAISVLADIMAAHP